MRSSMKHALCQDFFPHILIFLRRCISNHETKQTQVLHLINIHNLTMPFHWSILLIDNYFAVRYFRLFPYDRIPWVTVRILKQILHGSIGKIWHTTSPRYWYRDYHDSYPLLVPRGKYCAIFFLLSITM